MNLNVEKLSVELNGRKIIDDLSFSVSEGDIMVILGKNGAGKTVTLKAISGLINDYTGAVELFDPDTERSVSRPDELRERCAYVFQKGGLFDSMSVLDNVIFGLLRMGNDRNCAEKKGVSALDRVGLRGNEDKLPSQLSGGMQKRVGLARAMCMDRDIMIFDDPTAGLDPVLTDSMGDFIMESHAMGGGVFLLTTHDMRLVKRIARRVMLIYNGRAVFEGDAAEFFNGDNPYARQFLDGAIDGPIDLY